MRRPFQHLGACVLFAFTLAGCDGAAPRPPGNGGTGAPVGAARASDRIVLLVVFDALHAEHLTHLGYDRPTTPNLDRLAQDGVSFRHAFSPAPYTRAGIPSLLTGRLPDNHGVTSGGAILAQGETTIAELFAEHGLPTRAAVANLNGSELYALDQGFDEFENHMYPEDGRSRDFEEGGQGFHQPDAAEYVERVRGWIEKDGGAPAFYYLHYLEPHSPYHPPTAYRDLWLDPTYSGPFASGETKNLIASNKGTLPVDAADRAAVRALYDGTLAYADAQFGLLLDLLVERGLYDEALIVVTSDHGEALWQHGRFGHNTHLYDEMVHVPLIVKLPRSAGQAPRIEDSMVSMMDIVPSLVEWCGLGSPLLPMDGRSLQPILAGAARAVDPDRELVLRTNEDVPDLGLRTARNKTIVVRGPKGAVLRLEHYDLVRDPGESKNLVPGIGDVANRRSTLLREWQTSAVAHQVPRESVELSAAQALLLERLGYKAD